jgi:hypothetical protein
MSQVQASSHDASIPCTTLASVEERERRLIEAVVALARSLTEERDRLAARLHEVERELAALGTKLDARPGDVIASDGLSRLGTALRADRPPRPSRRRA